ncbi:hypothetical protein [Jatrophihabitans sp.]|uniref:hypothetical protein n=1 Tax=Jatrophihabitans sp. TaxID=1932789 RepID=UPI0030C76FA1|nr:hypothetical protein [Jatrophihabitans sp.]
MGLVPTPLPSYVKTGTVSGLTYLVGVDTVSDPDDQPDASYPAGSLLLFTPSVNYLSFTGDHATFYLDPVMLVVGDDGQPHPSQLVTDDDGQPLDPPQYTPIADEVAKVVANLGQTDNDQAWSWTVSPTINGKVFNSFKMDVTADTVNYLSDAQPIPSATPSSSVARGPAGIGAPPGGTPDDYIPKSVDDSVVYVDGTTLFPSKDNFLGELEIRRLSDVATAAGRKAAARAMADWTDRQQFSESCGSLAAYSQSVGSTLTAFGGGFFGGASGGAALVALPASGDGTFRASVVVFMVANMPIGDRIRVGFSTDAPGSAPNSANVAGIQLGSDGTSTSGPAESWFGTGIGGNGAGIMVTGPNTKNRTDTVTCAGNVVTDSKIVGSDFGASVAGAGFPAGTTITAVTPGTGCTLSNPATGTNMLITPSTQRWSKVGFWRIELISDGTTLSICLVDLATGTSERLAALPVSGLLFQTFYILNSDARGVGGSSIQPYSVRAGITSARPPASPTVATGITDVFASADLTDDDYRLQASSKLVGGGGRVIAIAGASSSNAGASKAFPVPAAASMSCSGAVHLSTAGSGTLAFGFDNQSTTAPPPTGTNSYRGLAFDTAGDLVAIDPAGAGTTTLASAVAAGTWGFAYASDGTTLVGTATAPDGSTTYSYSWTIAAAFAGAGIKNIRLLNTDATGSDYISGFTASYQVPSTGPDVAGYTGGQLTMRDSTHRIAARLATNWDSRKVYPTVLALHGADGNALTFAGGSGTGHYDALALAFAKAGFNFFSTEADPIGQEWADDDIVEGELETWQYAMNNFAPGPIFLYGGSMGALGTLVTMASRVIPGVAGIILNQPVCSLRAAYDSTGLRAGVTQAYGLGAYPDAGYAAATGPSATCKYGHDPLSDDMPPWALGGVPILVEHSPDDTTVPDADHFTPFVAKFGAYNEITVLEGEGDHGAAGQFSPFFGAQIAWALQQAGGLA